LASATLISCTSLNDDNSTPEALAKTIFDAVKYEEPDLIRKYYITPEEYIDRDTTDARRFLGVFESWYAKQMHRHEEVMREVSENEENYSNLNKIDLMRLMYSQHPDTLLANIKADVQSKKLTLDQNINGIRTELRKDGLEDWDGAIYEMTEYRSGGPDEDEAKILIRFKVGEKVGYFPFYRTSWYRDLIIINTDRGWVITEFPKKNAAFDTE